MITITSRSTAGAGSIVFSPIKLGSLQHQYAAKLSDGYQTLAEGQALVQGDRFLQVGHWEKVADFYYTHNYKEPARPSENARWKSD